MNYKLSIIVITFNNFDELKSTIKSIPRHPDFELIVINGGNCKLTKDYLFERRDLVHISEPDKGISDAFNKGFALSSGKYFIFINSGDILLDDQYLHSAIFALESNNSLNYCFSDIILKHSIAGEVYVKPKPIYHPGMPFCHQTLITRKSVIDETYPFSLKYKYAMDFDFFCKHLRSRGPGLYLPGASILMDGSGISSSNPIKVYRENISILKTYQSFWFIEYVKIHTFILRAYFKSAIQMIGLKPLVIKITKFKNRN